MNHDMVIIGAARTAIGKYGGSFRDLHPAELGAVAARAAIERASLRPDDIDEVWMGHGRQAGSGPNPQVDMSNRHQGREGQTVACSVGSFVAVVALWPLWFF